MHSIMIVPCPVCHVQLGVRCKADRNDGRNWAWHVARATAADVLNRSRQPEIDRGKVTGPISSLPGSSHDLPDGACCDQHSNRLAVRRVQGETDSFGCEMVDQCQECWDADRNAPPELRTCDWCKTPNVETRPRRDYEEGMGGPVYEVCDPCVKRENDKLDLELAENHYEPAWLDDD